MRAILEAFPGARIEAVHDDSTDAYGLPAAAPLGDDTDAAAAEFTPVDAELADGPPEEAEN